MTGTEPTRSDEQIRQDLKGFERYGAWTNIGTPYDFTQRLAADVRPLLDRSVAAESEAVSLRAEVARLTEERDTAQMTADEGQEIVANLRREVAMLERDLVLANTIALNAADAARLTCEQHSAGVVDPVEVIAAITRECLNNRAALAASRAEVERLTEELTEVRSQYAVAGPYYSLYYDAGAERDRLAAQLRAVTEELDVIRTMHPPTSVDRKLAALRHHLAAALAGDVPQGVIANGPVMIPDAKLLEVLTQWASSGPIGSDRYREGYDSAQQSVLRLLRREVRRAAGDEKR